MDNKHRKLRGEEKLSRIPIKVPKQDKVKSKPEWLRIKIHDTPEKQRIKKVLRANNLHTVCEEASCPNLNECFNKGTATFMIMGDICTRRCPFCDVAHGKPKPLDSNEPINLAKTILQMKLKHVVVTSVDRDDLRDGGASHFVACIKEIRNLNPGIIIEVLVPDFRGRADTALEVLSGSLPNIFNHNIETVLRLYKQVRPGSDYQYSLNLLYKYKQLFKLITKSGIMLGLGETTEEIISTMQDLRKHEVDAITLGQYLQPSIHHLPVDRFIPPNEFDKLALIAKEIGFKHVTSGPLVRSSYYAEQQISLS